EEADLADRLANSDLVDGAILAFASNRPDTTMKTESDGVFRRTGTSPRSRLRIFALDQMAVSGSFDNSRKIAVERTNVFKVPGLVDIVPVRIFAEHPTSGGLAGRTGVAWAYRCGIGFF